MALVNKTINELITDIERGALYKASLRGRLFGGIVANTDSRNYQGVWKYFDKPSKELKNDLSNWKELEL